MKKQGVVLAEHPGLGRIHLCECSSVHLSLGPVTLNLEPAAFLQMASLIGKAAEEFSQLQEKNKTPEFLFDLLDSTPNRLMN